MCLDGLVQLLMMLAKPRTKLLRNNRNAYYMLIMCSCQKFPNLYLIEFSVLIWKKIQVNCITVAEIRK